MRRICMLLLPPAALAGGYCLRMQQSLAPAADAVPLFFKNRWGIFLWAMLGLLALLLLLLGLGEEKETGFQTSCRAAVGLPFQWAGTILFCFAGVNAAMSFWPGWQTVGFYLNAATALASFFLLPAVMMRFRRSEKGVGLFLLPPLLLILYRLLRYYLSIAADPDIRSQEMKLVFFAAFTLFFLALTALAFGDHCRRRLLLFAGFAPGAAGAALVDTAVFNDALLIVAGALLASGFYFSALFAEESAPAYELVADEPFAKKCTAPPEKAPEPTGSEAPQQAAPAGDDPFPVIFDEGGNKLPPPEAPAKTASAKKDGELDLSRVDQLMREMK